MNPLPASGRPTLLATVLVGLAIWIAPARAQSATVDQGTNEIRIAELQGTVEISPAGSTRWFLTQTNQSLRPSDQLRTGPNSRVALRWSDQSVVSFGALTVLEILPPHEPGAANGLKLLEGLLSFFHRDEPGRIRVITRGGTAGVKGTEFVVAVETVNGTERTTLSVIDGTVEFGNEQGSLSLTNSRQAVAELGKAPTRTAGFNANNVLQWCFYYPAVLDLRDLPFTPGEEQILNESLAAYRGGDLLAALAKYPERQPGSDAERVYYAALLLSVGQVEKTEAALDVRPADPSERFQRLATALRQIIAAVKRQPNPSIISPQLSTEFLAASYYEQSRAVREDSLKGALHLATQSAAHSPQFGFAWARVAELEFSFGQNARALEALKRSIELSPRNAQALALKAFLLAAQNKTREAIDEFNRAMEVDSALGNAWLGRGLCRIRRGDTVGGREDLLIAAALEPQRAFLRSYLGKAYSNAGDTRRASYELDLAKRLDPADPTAWLYSALLNEQNNRLNEGIRDLEKSQELNDNRRLYRSRFLLDQDRAVRSSSLAEVYHDAGMPEVSVREAARAVSYDYANYSAHQFLSESYNTLRDPTRFNLRYETVWFSELLLANLLSPVGGTPLSQNISQQEYSRLFERNRIGLASSTEYRSDGQWHQLASQYGNIDNTGWSFDLDYHRNDGVRPNNDLESIEWYSTIKQQLTPQDSLLLLTKYQDYLSGDNFQYYNSTNTRPDFRYDEYQSPIALIGYHHEWRPGVHTLLLGGRLENDQRFSDRGTPQTLFDFERRTNLLSLDFDRLDVQHRSELEIYTVEAQQIFENERHALVLGARWQRGTFDTHSVMTNPEFYNGDTNRFGSFPTNAADIHVVDDFEWISGYAYETLKLPGRLNVTAGAAYEHLQFPENFRSPPIQSGEEFRDRLSPKAAIFWQMTKQTTVRGVYARSLGGVSLDESFRLEPTQLGGYSQAFRTLIPESLIGSVAAPRHEIWGAALDLKFPKRTYIGFYGEMLRSKIQRTVGLFDLFVDEPFPNIFPASTRQDLNYDERLFRATVNQLFSDEWALGAQYSFVRSELKSEFPAASQVLGPYSVHADLHQLNLSLLYNHQSGFFSEAEIQWLFQCRSRAITSISPQVLEDVPNESVPQLNFLVGYRFPRQRGDIALGALNATGEDYRLNPVTPYSELPRKAVLYARLRIRF